MAHHSSFFHRHHRLLAALATAYVVLLIVSHATLPQAHVWGIAVVFSVAMNGTYLIEAVSRGHHTGTEAAVSGGLIALSLLGLIAPPCVIAAIFLHGCWDLAKHLGAGVPFFRWYTLSCALIDGCYSAALLAYLLIG